MTVIPISPGLQRVGQLVARTIAHMRASVRPGITTAELDDIGERFARPQARGRRRSSRTTSRASTA